MSLSKVCLRIIEDSVEEAAARTDNAAVGLINWIDERLADEGIEIDDTKNAVIRHLVARAMVAQHDFDAEVANMPNMPAA